MKPLAMRSVLGIALVSVLCGTSAAAAATIEFEVPLELHGLPERATHAEVICGSYVPGRFLNSNVVAVALGRESDPKYRYFEGIVTVPVTFPEGAPESGAYRCEVRLRTTRGVEPIDEHLRAPHTSARTWTMGDFRELNYQENRSIRRTPSLLPPPR